MDKVGNYLYRNQSIHSINQTIALQNISYAIDGGTVEVSALRPQTETPRSLRRPLDQVIVV
jgi:hypothetical protein